VRTRIALVAIIPIAVITISTLVQAVTVQSTGAVPAPSTGSSISSSSLPPDQLIAYRNLATARPASVGPDHSFGLGALLPDQPIPAPAPAPAPAAAPAAVAAPAAPAVTGPVDTVTAAQRAAWERVAMCEEGGSWTSDGGAFSGGLGISRTNWDAYGGTQFAPDGAEATEDEQIMVAERIQSSPPDQDGCQGW
jgi:hypothetical protein